MEVQIILTTIVIKKWSSGKDNTIYAEAQQY
jgi:hypothetical protein